MSQQQRAVVQQALEAHQALREWISSVPSETVLPAMPGINGDWLDEVETSLRQLLEAEPAQEPVAWWIPKAEQFCMAKPDGSRPFAKAWQPLYTTPPAQPAAWVGLTDAEIAEAGQLNVEGPRMLPYAFARAVEAKLREKNGGQE
jgi:hypothetical protein